MGTAPCRQDCSKRWISRFRLITTAFRSRYLDRLMRITATNQISTTCPSKPNIGRQRTSWIMSGGPKGEKRPAVNPFLNVSEAARSQITARQPNVHNCPIRGLKQSIYLAPIIDSRSGKVGKFYPAVLKKGRCVGLGRCSETHWNSMPVLSPKRCAN